MRDSLARQRRLRDRLPTGKFQVVTTDSRAPTADEPPRRPRRPKRLRGRPRPVLTIGQVLAWADAFRVKHGRWPRATDGRVEGTDEKWYNLSASLRYGTRGFPGGSSLAQVLAEHRGHRNRKRLPPYTVGKILAWADRHRRSTGDWPCPTDGAIADATGETWCAVDQALCKGKRGLPGGSSLAQLLQEHRGFRHTKRLPDLTAAGILAWADAHHERTGSWTAPASGAIVDAPGETWSAVQNALVVGRRGLPGGSTLPRFLEEHRGVPKGQKPLPPLDPAEILRWADAFHRKHKRWPRSDDGAIPGSGGKTWVAVHCALKCGRRGFPEGTTLASFLVANGRGRNLKGLPPLTVEQIREWAEAHKRRTGAWPTIGSGPIPDAPGEKWSAVAVALSHGRRGLPGGTTLCRLLADTPCTGPRNEIDS